MANSRWTNPRWSFVDCAGYTHKGILEGFTDRGGTDITYYFRDEVDDTLHLVSGTNLKRCNRIWEK